MKNNRRSESKKRALLVFLALTAAVFFLWSRNVQAVFFLGRGNGQAVVLLPESRQKVPDMVYYFQQKDPLWAGEHLGEARDTMASSGCLVCSLAAGLEMQKHGTDPDAAPVMTAGELNQRFSEAQVYTDSGAVIWDRIPDAVPGTVSYVAEDVRREEIDRFLAEGIFPVVKVRVDGTGAFHWVLLIGADENSYLCMDPLKEGKTPVSLEQFQNRVYAMRAVYYKDSGIIN